MLRVACVLATANLPVLPPAVLVLSLLGPAVAFALAVALVRYAVLRPDHWVALLVYGQSRETMKKPARPACYGVTEATPAS